MAVLQLNRDSEWAAIVSLNFSGKRSQSWLERGRGARISVGTPFEVSELNWSHCSRETWVDSWVKMLVRSGHQKCVFSVLVPGMNISLASRFIIALAILSAFLIFSGLQIRVCIGKLFSVFLTQNICCGYSKEPSQLRRLFWAPKTHV